MERVPVAGKDGERCLPSIFVPAGPDRVALSPAAFLDVLHHKVDLPVGETAPRPLLIFDQFEEWVTLFEDAAASDSLARARASQEAVAQVIVHLLVETRLPVKILLALREDYLAKLSPLLARCPNLSDQSLRLGPLRGADIRRVIREPFERWRDRYHPEITEALAARVVAQFDERSGAADIRLTELQIVCRSLFEAGQRGQDMDALFSARGVQGLLEDYLENQLGALDARHREAALVLLSRMVTSLGTRKVVAEDDLVPRVAEEERIPRAVLGETLEQLERQTRIIRRDRRRDVYYYEIASEFLIPWVGERRRERETLAKQRALEQAQEQLRAEKSRAEQLEAAWAQARDKAEEARRAAHKARRRARGAFALAGVAAAVAGLAGWLYFESSSRALAAAARNKLSVDPELSVVLALQAANTQRTSEAVDVLAEAVHESRARHTLSTGLQDPAGLSASADGRWLATLRLNNVVEIWERAPGSKPVRVGETGEVTAIALSPAGTRLATARRDGQITIWDAPFITPRGTLNGRVEGIRSLAFSPDGTLLATADGNGLVKLWKTSSGLLRDVVDGEDRGSSGPPRRNIAMGFSPPSADPRAETYLASVTAGSGADEVLIWSVERRTSVRVPLERNEGVNGFAVGPHARQVAIAVGATVRFIDVASQRRLETTLRGHAGDVRAIAFTADGSRVATASADRTARVWDAASGQELLAMRGHSAALVAVAFGPESSITTTSQDGSARVWDAAVTRHTTRASAMALSADEKYLAVASHDGAMRVWDMKSAGAIRELRGEPGPVIGIAFAKGSADGRVTAAVQNREARAVVQLRDIASGRVVQEFTTPNSVLDAALAPDGTHLVALEAAQDGALARVWRISPPHEIGAIKIAQRPRFLALSAGGGRLALWQDALASTPPSPPRTPMGEIEVFDVPSGKSVRKLPQPARVTWLTLSHDGRRVAAASAGRTVKVWSVESGEETMSVGSSDQISVIVFSQDGEQLASINGDHTTQVWDVASRRLAWVFRHRGPVDAVTFGSSRGRVATCSLENISVRPLRIDDLVELGERGVTRPLTAWECREYLGPMRFWLAARAWWSGRGQPCR